MPRNLEYVPYGYVPPKPTTKGTLIFYDLFEQIQEELQRAVTIKEERSFEKLVLYPLHEETARRMFKGTVSPYHKREKQLEEWIGEHAARSVVIESFESKRKKYTPIDTALHHLAEKYKGPYFLLLTPEVANSFASYSSFEEWIVKLRLILLSKPSYLHPRLEKFSHRWDVAGEKREDQ
ncbi:hypothetical protein AMS62_23385 [Bacillus sp. FJAT-18019]|uniref:Uncharacterized protein n=1 Tax=Paenibacillus solani TaxID=1705565 RepID=A0A0M1P5N2_9BACL|nr:hypothetical protein [Paenibacillus solani]KOP67866.1 hypothetical protein AMS62_23385 [Bacillus sp. FJAT-18019]KOR89793.1 hypothetical protein AM231_12030 [Paenibacillus solani]